MNTFLKAEDKELKKELGEKLKNETLPEFFTNMEGVIKANGGKFLAGGSDVSEHDLRRLHCKKCLKYLF